MKKLNVLLCGIASLMIMGSAEAAEEWNVPGVVKSTAKAKKRSIKKIESITVETPQGTAPRLPWQVWVEYSDGTGEWRQTKWMNSARATEEEQAAYPVGKEYTVEGYIIGDNSTDNGYPLSAKVRVVAEQWSVPSNRPVAEPLPLGSVHITGNNRLTSNRDIDIRRLLSLDVTQQLYNYRDTYGLPTEGYKRSDGWDSPTTKLKGHGTGHYLSALAFAYAGTDDAALKAQLKANIKRMVDEMRECQERTFVYSDSLGRYFEARDYAPEAELKEMKGTWAAFDEYKKDYQHYGYGYINAIPAAHPALIECYRAYNNDQWVWAPYYTIHKQLAGLIDISNNVDDEEIADKALLIATDMGLWVWNRLHYRTYVKTDGTREERQARPGNRYEMWNMYIAGEVGGMQESLSRLSEMATNPTDKAHLLEAANYFDAPAFYQPLSQNIDDIRTRHANQHIPMITGALRSYRGNNNPYYYNIAYNFWNMIQGRYAYAMGGVGNGEMFRQPYSQMLSMNTSAERGWGGGANPNPNINETCCAYNLAKLTKDLNCFDPDDAAYMDYYERVLYNQLVGSVHPEHFAVTYQYAVGIDAQKEFGSNTPQSTCCGGTGVENHVKYQEAAYFVNDATMWIALYMPTTAHWAQKGIKLEQQCLWPAEKSTIKITEGTAQFTMKLRVPYWATDGFDVKLNGKSIAKKYQPCSYIEIPARTWQVGDVVEVIMPFTRHINFGPDKMELAATRENANTPFPPQWEGAIMYGPLVMTTEEITEWSQADIDLSADLSDILLQGPTSDSGTNGNIYRLSVAGKTFVPDYYEIGASTHYLRLNVQSASKSGSGKVTKTELESAIKIAQERREAQESWNAMAVKVPAHAPWAPNGYARLMQALATAETVGAKPTKSLTQAEVNSALSALNAVINTMRPGNLAEPEDLNELQPLLTQAKRIRNKTTELREAIDYADMVVDYVNNGSGTHDFIDKAISGLQEALKTVADQMPQRRSDN
ncbi:MAG: glycoside hydrolase family 127 protein [Bacteroidaceae bacterium]|nr:glycoside hydrolase family 127 protein [Bacteroidaceae bacterium]